MLWFILFNSNGPIIQPVVPIVRHCCSIEIALGIFITILILLVLVPLVIWFLTRKLER